MKKEIKKTKTFDIAVFETLDANGIIVLKGGFSPAYDESLAFGGEPSTDVPITNNSVLGCACTLNMVAGCACSQVPQVPQTA